MGGQARGDQGLILVDSSVWVEFLRRIGFGRQVGPQAAVRPTADGCDLPARPDGAAADRRRSGSQKIERTLAGLPTIELVPDADLELAADIYRAVRHGGLPVRSMIDCLIAAGAHPSGAELVHRDADMERIAAVLPGLRSRSLRCGTARSP